MSCTRIIIYVSNRKCASHVASTLEWCHNERVGLSNHRCPECLHNHFFRRKSKKTSKLRVTSLWEGNSPVTGEFPAQWTSNAENASIQLRHHVFITCTVFSSIEPLGTKSSSICSIIQNINAFIQKKTQLKLPFAKKGHFVFGATG